MWKVMLADDEPFIKEGMEKLISWKSLGCEIVYSASNGRELIERMELETPDIVIVDIKMPVIGGLEVAQYIQDKKLDIKVIVLTAYADFQYAHKAIKCGVSDYVVKTSALDDIPKAVEKVTEALSKERFAKFRLLLFQGAVKEEASKKLIDTVFEPFEYKIFPTESEENCILITGEKVIDEEKILETCIQIKSLYLNFLNKNIGIGVSSVFHKIQQSAEYYSSLETFLNTQMTEKGPDIFWQQKEEQIKEQIKDDLPLMEETDYLVKRINAYIDQNYFNKITLDDIGEAVHANRSYLSRLYKQKTGCNLFDMINIKRIELAKKYIIEQEKKMYEIAILVGFEDTAYFSRVFKRVEGISPKEFYRKNCREIEDSKKKNNLVTNIKILTVLLFCICSLTACGIEKGEKTEITLIHGWGAMDEDHVIMRSIYEDFEKENPDIKLNMVSMPSSFEVINKVNDMLATGKIPDIIFSGGYGKESFYKFIVDKNYAVNYMPFIQEDKEFEKDVNNERIDYWLTEQGELYSIPDVLLYSGGYWYNEEIFRDAGIQETPKTWEDYFAVCEKLKEWAGNNRKNIVPVQINEENSLYYVDAFLLEEDTMKWEIEPKQFTDILDSLKKIYNYSNNMNEINGYRDVLGTFNAGKSAMYVNGVWANSMINPELKVSYALLPSKNESSISCISACLGYVVGNTGDQKKIEASVRFVKYMVSDAVQERILKETGQIPSNPSIDIAKYKIEMPRLFHSAEVVKNAEIKIEVPENLWDSGPLRAYNTSFMDVMNGEIKEQDFIDMIR